MIDPRRRLGQNTVPYTVAFWYGTNNKGPANVTLMVDGPCYTGENETYVYPIPAPVDAVTNYSSNKQATSS